jgi:hypothetical protein
MMVAAPAGQLLVSAVSLLDQGRGIDRLSRLLTAAALAALVGIAVWGVHQPVPVALLALAVLAGVVEVYLAIRVGFDAALFRHLADAAETGTRDLANLDAALMAIGLVPASKAGRPLEARVAGACRLFYQQAGSVALQVALFLLGAVTAALT